MTYQTKLLRLKNQCEIVKTQYCACSINFRTSAGATGRPRYAARVLISTIVIMDTFTISVSHFGFMCGYFAMTPIISVYKRLATAQPIEDQAKQSMQDDI